MSWNSRYCGTRWKLTYTDPQGVSTCINITAIDTPHHNHDEFKISLDGMIRLMHGHAMSLSKASITAVRLPKSSCGL
ncbi:hypothetical protein J3R82DRAFT_5124 [Butyriboletus roseoflavus]|nr:hypothetical protein J3R82DRAFT_5124 [Butyriboletus roseoflavus]